ncbi:MAG: InlB B-repeat-containing protein, partial [Firmicutes bacterium]|nr:InlB B-repeat-containing protein [Bacillota bacterium]
ITYYNNDRVGTAQLMIVGIGEYSGANTLPFTIVEKSIKDATVEIEKAGDPPKAVYEYTGAPIVPVITVKVGDDELVLNTDYYLTYNPDNTNICEDDKEITVTVHGIGNYKDIADMTDTFQIIGRNLGDAEVTYTDTFVYTGEPIKPDVTVRIDGRTLKMQTDTETGDYTVEYSNNVHAGDSAIIRIVPTNPEYGGEKYVTFKITTATNTVTAEPAINGWTWKEEPSSLSAEMQTKFGTHVYSVYSDEACTDNCLVDKVSPADLSEAMRNLDAGTYYLYAEVEKSDEYPDDYTTVSSKVPFTVTPADFTGEVEVTLDYDIIAYNGTAREPSVTVTYKGKDLPDTNYSVAYTNNVEPGDATVTITGKGNCVGTATAQFTINPIYTVTFNLNGEGVVFDSDLVVEVEKGHSISRPEDPTWEGHRFVEWISNESLIGDAYDFDSAVNDNVNLYAKWTNEYTVTYVLYDDVIIIEIKEENETLAKPSDPVRPGYSFDGWYANTQGDGPDNMWQFGNKVQRNETIYAHWTEMPDVKVTFNTNGGTTETFEQDVKYNGLATEPEIPVYEGHNFEGWYKDPECTEQFDFDMPVTAEVTLYAKWS